MASDRSDFNGSVVCGISDIGRIADGVAVGWPRMGIEIHFSLAVVSVKCWVDRESSTGIAEFLCDVTSRESALDCIGSWTISYSVGGLDFWSDVFDERPGGSVCAGYRSGGVATAQLGLFPFSAEQMMLARGNRYSRINMIAGWAEFLQVCWRAKNC